MTIRFYKLHADPGHAWVAIKRKELRELGIETLITGFSYQKGKTVYLEEDVDATTLVKRLKELDITYSFTEKFSNRRSPIRNYEEFKIEDKIENV